MDSTAALTAAVNAAPPAGGQWIDRLKAKRLNVANALSAMVEGAQARGQDSLLASEQRAFDKARVEIAELDLAIDKAEDDERREAGAAEARRRTSGGPGWSVTGEAAVYRPDEPTSFFKDLYFARAGDFAASERLFRNQAQAVAENRAVSTVAGAGGEFAPPGWLVQEFVRLARPGRVTADLLHREDLPSGISSVNLPRVATGTTTAVQAGQNTALSQTDLTTNSVESPIVTIGGKQVVSQQMLEQSGIPFDRVILGDLAADYAKQFDQQAINGSGAGGQLRGILTVTGNTAVTYTSTTPSAQTLYSKLADLQQQVATTRFLPITAWVMHPRRWAWLASQSDANNRPLVVPDGNGFNQVATAEQVAAEGRVGSLLGTPVHVDPSIPTNLGAGTNEDRILGLRADDLWLWEGALKAETFTAPYADSMGVLFRVYAYSAAIPDRYPASVGVISGTGLTTPTF